MTSIDQHEEKKKEEIRNQLELLIEKQEQENRELDQIIARLNRISARYAEMSAWMIDKSDDGNRAGSV